MKAIKDCKWKISLCELETKKYVWAALVGGTADTGDRYHHWQQFRTMSGCKRNAERFRQVNKIPKKNWIYA